MSGSRLGSKAVIAEIRADTFAEQVNMCVDSDMVGYLLSTCKFCVSLALRFTALWYLGIKPVNIVGVI